MAWRCLKNTSNSDQSSGAEGLILANHQILTEPNLVRTKFGLWRFL
jgi:hypothetical protein